MVFISYVFKKNDLDSTRALNRARILRLLFEKGSLPRNQIAEMIGLTQASVSRIVAECIEASLIIEEKEIATAVSGRRPIPVSLNPAEYYVVGVHIGKYWIDVGLLNLRAEMIDHIHYDRPHEPVESVFFSIKQQIEALRSKHSAFLVGIGIILSGQVNQETGEILKHNIFGWDHTPIRSWFEKQLNVRTIIDTNMYALATTEFVKNPLPPNHILILVNVGDTIGMAMVINSVVLRGKQRLTGFLEHMPWQSEGPSCECGINGCLTSVLSDRALLSRARQLRPELDIPDIHVLVELSKNDEGLQNLLRVRAENLGRFLSVLSTLHDPAKLVLTGSCYFGGNEQFLWAQKSYEHYLQSQNRDFVKLSTPNSGKTVFLTLISAASTIAIQTFFTSAFDVIPKS